MKSYKQHLKSSHSFGENIDNIRKPVFCGSAIFTVINNNKLKTRILYMGYWIIKRQIKEVSLLITLRDSKGIILLRNNSLISKGKSEEINIEQLLQKIKYTNAEFIGSIELEIFSSRDLVFPYPAFVVNYYNDYGSSVVHTTGRIYNDFEDASDNEVTHVKECGFDIFPSDDNEPFFTFVNGHTPNNGKMTFEVITEKNTYYKKNVTLGEIGALETVLIKFKNYLPIKDILNNGSGTIKIKHSLTGFFPRFIAGNFSKKTNTASITHTYYDNSNNTDESSYWHNNNEEILYDSAVNIPLFINEYWYTQLKMYPIYSPSSFTISIYFYNKDGVRQGELVNYKNIKKSDNKYLTIDFKELALRLGLDLAKINSAKLIQNWQDKNAIPTRLKYGLNIGQVNLDNDLPTNICFSPAISNIKILDKNNSFKWFPLLNNSNSVAVIGNSSYVKGYNKVANIDANFYRKQDNKTILRNYKIPVNGIQNITIDKELSNFFNNDPGWATINSDNPFINAWYFEFNKSGVMGGDHAF